MAYYSQNGYTAATSSAGIPSGTVRVTPKGGNKAYFVVRKDISAAFQYLVDRLDAEVENVDEYSQGDDWSYFFRAIRGSSADNLSNHASGTAIDYNATQHPLGTKASDNWSSAQINKIHEILRALGGCVRFGGDYSGRGDPMHFEIVKSPTEVAVIMKKLLTPPPAPFSLSAFKGSVKVIGYNLGYPSHVKVVQTALREVGETPGPVDGDKGPATVAAMNDFLAKWGWPEATGKIITFRMLDRLIWEAEKRKPEDQYPTTAEK